MKILILLLLVKLNVSDDTPVTTQHVPHSCGQLKLNEVEKSCKPWWPFCKSYELRFYDLTTTNDTISGTANNIKCIICKLDPHGEGEYTTIGEGTSLSSLIYYKPCPNYIVLH